MDKPDDIRALFDHVPDEDPLAERRALDRLRAHMASSRAGSQPPAPERRPRRRWAVVGAAALVMVTVATMILLPMRRDGPSSASALLGRLSATAAAQPSRELEGGDYLYTRSQELRSNAGTAVGTGSSWRYVVRVVRESWFATNGSGRILTSYGEPTFLTDADRDAWKAAGSPPLIPAEPSDEVFQAGEFPSPDLSGLPTDPQELREKLVEDDRENGTEGDSVFEAVGRLLSETGASPKLRAALFEVAASLPGVAGVGVTRDPLGRSGVAVEQTGDGRSIRLVFDPSTSVLLSIEQLRNHLLESWMSYEEPRVVPTLRS